MTSDLAVIVGSTTSATDPGSPRGGLRALATAAAAWFVVAAIGQLMFAVYVIGAYGLAIVTGRLEDWNRVLPPGHGYIAGDPVGNAALFAHLALVVVVMVGGVLQLTPAVRRRWPTFHRWTGRTYLTSVLIVTLGGFVLKLIREPVFDWITELGSKITGVLIIICAVMALVCARAGHFALHRRWALRLFLAASGVWFIRIGWSLWRTIASAFGLETPDSLFTVMSLGQVIVPLVVLELYLRARDRGGPGSRAAMAALLGVLTVATAVGIIAVTARMWLPRL